MVNVPLFLVFFLLVRKNRCPQGIQFSYSKCQKIWQGIRLCRTQLKCMLDQRVMKLKRSHFDLLSHLSKVVNYT